ncbi:unnamed protein product [Closterium sp. NIES-64]|nr:unnamed protein product [Closterium sp. NIES-64]
MASLLERTKIGALVSKKKEIISVPDIATVLDALDLMNANGIVALPVAAPPGKWLGAGGANIVDGEKQYIGVVSMAWQCMWSGEHGGERVREGAMTAALKAGVQGHSPPARALPHRPRCYPLPSTAAPTAMTFGHATPEALETEETPVEGAAEIAAFLLLHVDALGDVAECTVEQLGLADSLFPPLAIVSGLTVTDALRLMQHAGGVRAVAVVAGSAEEERMEESEGSGGAGGSADVAGG